MCPKIYPHDDTYEHATIEIARRNHVALIRRPRIHATAHAADTGLGVSTEGMVPKHQRPRMLRFFSEMIDMSESVDGTCRLDKKKLMTL